MNKMGASGRNERREAGPKPPALGAYLTEQGKSLQLYNSFALIHSAQSMYGIWSSIIQAVESEKG